MTSDPKRRSGRGISLYLYVALYCLVTLALYQGAQFGYVTSAVDPGSAQGIAILATLTAIQLLLTAGLLLILGLVSVWLMKIVGAVLLVTNAAAQYFMASYAVVIDRTMIANILNTNSDEAGGLFHPMLVLSIVLWGVLPALVALWLPVRKRRRLGAAAALLAVTAGLVGTVYAASSTWLWFDEHGNRVGPRVLPWAYIGNGARYAAEYQRRNRVPTALPDATLSAPRDTLREVVVLAIGEAARGDHLAALGYARDTTPFTAPLGVVAYPGGRSCTTYTLGSVACILSHIGNDAEISDPYEPLPSYLNRAGVATIVRTNNTGMPPLPGVTQQTVRELHAGCEPDCPERLYDDALLTGLTAQIEGTEAQRVFVLLHLAGSHGPAYNLKYPPEFEAFSPVCETTLVSDCTREELVNAYDNSIRFTDHVLAELIGALDTLPDTRATLLYVADHGQSLGENGIYLHGLPNSIAPEDQRRVPLLLWFNTAMAQARGLDPRDMSEPVDNPQDQIFHTVLGAFGVQSPIYRPENDLLLRGQERAQERAQDGLDR